jgi:hypothetical protein
VPAMLPSVFVFGFVFTRFALGTDACVSSVALVGLFCGEGGD